jgi:pimeloyl-ACP methyl ester carboxylesterase
VINAVLRDAIFYSPAPIHSRRRHVEVKTIPLGQRPARVWTGGSGEAIVLLHGGWAGAEAYWSTVTGELERSHQVVAPDLPGIGVPGALLASFSAYAAWLDAVLDALAVERATIIGNSLGATIAWRFASRYPERCRGLVMVNGYPPPAYNRGVRWMAAHTSVRRMVRSHFLRSIYGSEALATAFHDRRNAPAAIVSALDRFSPAEVDAVLDILLAESACPAPQVRTLLIWGEADRLPVLDKRGARKMAPSLGDYRLVTIPSAGHLPQVEHPVAFLRALREFLRR